MCAYAYDFRLLAVFEEYGAVFFARGPVFVCAIPCELARRRLHKEQESVDELARDFENVLDRASPGLSAEIRDSELPIHFIIALPENVAIQLKLLLNYGETMPKARGLLLIYRQADNPINQVRVDRRDILEEMTLYTSVTVTSSPGYQSTRSSRNPTPLQVEQPSTFGQGLQILNDK